MELSWHNWSARNDRSDELIIFRRQYLQLVEPKLLPFPDASTWRAPGFQRAFHSLVLSDRAHRYVPPKRYRLRVLKRIVDDLQRSFQVSEEDEISDDILTTYSNLITEVRRSEYEEAQAEVVVIYTLPYSMEEPPEIHLVESRSILAASGSTGFRTWEAALYLGKFLCSFSGNRLVKNKSVLELGMGTGFLSILCAHHLGAKYVLATDGCGDVVEKFVAHPSFHDGEKGAIVPAVLSWGSSDLCDSIGDSQKQGKFDLIIGADVTYDPSSIPLLVSTIFEVLSQSADSVAMIAATVRNENTIQVLLNTCVHYRIVVEEIMIPDEDQGRQQGFFHPTSTPIRILVLSLCRKRDPEHALKEGLADRYRRIIGPENF